MRISRCSNAVSFVFHRKSEDVQRIWSERYALKAEAVRIVDALKQLGSRGQQIDHMAVQRPVEDSRDLYTILIRAPVIADFDFQTRRGPLSIRKHLSRFQSGP
jgi:hypothetical protein